MGWYWCLEHKCVEHDLGCGSTTRICPYETQAEAASALARTHQRGTEQEALDAKIEKSN